MPESPIGTTTMRVVATCSVCGGHVVGGECDDGGALAPQSKHEFARLRDALMSAGWVRDTDGLWICNRCEPLYARALRKARTR